MSLAALAIKLIIPLSTFASPPEVGTTAHYELAVDRARTSPFVKQADVYFTVTESSDEAVKMEIDYSYKVIIASGSDTQEKVVPVASLDPNNLDRLRAGEVITTEDATIQHIGYEAVNLKGLVYQTDVLEVTNVKSPLQGLTDIKAKVYVSTSVLLLGVVRVDATASFNGLRLKAGLDYVHPARWDI